MLHASFLIQQECIEQINVISFFKENHSVFFVVLIREQNQ